LNDSARNCKDARSRIAVFFTTERFTLW
jgi:hypothetical protein